MRSQWAWYVIYFLLVGAAGLLVCALRLTRKQLGEARQQRDNALLALHLNVARQAGEEHLRDLMGAWFAHCEAEALEFDDGDDVAHTFADFLANATGQTIVAQQLNGEGIVVAIPDEEKPDA